MGRDATCTLRIGRRRLEGEALLETGESVFRGEERLRFPLAKVKCPTVQRGWLSFTFEGAPVSLELGAEAAKWLAKIQNPKSVLDKLGVKPGIHVAVLGLDDAAFAKQLAARAADMSSRVTKDAALVFLGATAVKDLTRLAAIEKMMPRDGAVWVVWPKGRPELKEDHVRARAIATGLVDVKVVAFSATHSALKLVIPRVRR